MLTPTLKNSAALASLLLAASTLVACNPFKLLTDKKSAASAEAASTTESKKSGGADKAASNADKPTDKPASDKAAPAADGPVWIEEITGEKKKMARVDISVAEVAGLSILAPEGAKVAASPGGRGAEIEDSAYGYLVWVREDPTATIELMKKGATAWNKDTKFVKEGKTSFVISQPSYDGSLAYYFKGIYKSGSKIIVCETPTSIAPTKQEHAEQIGKACDSLQAAGGVKLAADGDAPAEPTPDASASAVAANDPPPPAGAPVAVAGNGAPAGKTPAQIEAEKKAYADQQNASLNSMMGGGAPAKATATATPPPPTATAKPPAGPRRNPLKKLR